MTLFALPSPSRALAVSLLGLALFTPSAHAAPPSPRPAPQADGWRVSGADAVRGITVGPIENGYHPGVGYGSPAYGRTLDECAAMGATWVAITPFGRVHDLAGTGIDLTFEAPFLSNRDAILRAIRMAHARGLHVMLVPHLWVESGEWRAQIDPASDDGWRRWAASYRAFVLAWAKVAEAEHAELFSAGVELRSWVTTSRAPSFAAILGDIRGIYHGLLTYSANWDDVDQTVILGQLDVIGVNAFYPLADKEGADDATMLEGGGRVREKVHALAEEWQKPVLFTEIGYTTRPDPAVRPWEWPDAMKGVVPDQQAQARAYRALLAPLLDEPDFAGFFVWRVYSDPDDVSQEAEWGFSPRGKRAELVVRDAFAARWAGDGGKSGGIGWAGRAEVPGWLP
jgi:hypothetical protein